MDPKTQLEQQIAAELRHLPRVQAPATLAPRVMARLQALSAVPWHQRTWFQWPTQWRLVSAGVATLALLAVWWGWGALCSEALQQGGQLLENATNGMRSLASQWQSATTPIRGCLFAVAPVLINLIGFAIVLIATAAGLAGTIGLLLKRELNGK